MPARGQVKHNGLTHAERLALFAEANGPALRAASALARQCGRWRDHDDAAQAALLGVWEASRTFEQGRGATWLTHALNYARHYVLTCFREARLIRLPKGVRVDGAVFCHASSSLLSGRHVPPAPDRLELDDELEAAIVQLTPTERELVRAACRGERDADVARRRGIKERCLREMRRVALLKLGLKPRAHGRPKLGRKKKRRQRQCEPKK